jgi:UDP-3-O-[3-hydroxymyristoyl] glucosamine N-acyltransferase
MILLVAETWPQEASAGDQEARQQLVGRRLHRPRPTHRQEASEDNVWLGGGVIVCPGVSIGENTVVGAGAVVVRDLPANVIAVGNPAQVIRSL